MKFTRKKQSGVDAEIPLVGLMDIMFNLVLFFVVATTWQTSSGIDIKLPEATSEIKPQEIRKVIVAIQNDGAIFFENEQTDEIKILEKFKALALKNEKVLIVIRADKIVMHGKVVEIMDAARTAGLTNLAIATVSKQPD